MFKAIGEFWAQNNIGGKLYLIYAGITMFAVLMFLIQYIVSNPKKKLKFIENASKNGCMAVGKMTCLTTHGVGEPKYFHAEYMYVVNEKRYFVTYKMAVHVPMDDRMDCMNADMLLLKLRPVMILFYDKNRPKKVLSKLEVFTSEEGICQIATPKKNVWRNTECDWTKPIDLVSY